MGNRSHIPGLFLREAELRRGLELIIRADRAMSDAAEASISIEGINQTDYRTLVLIARNEGLSMTDLQHLLRIRKQSLSPIMDRLKKAGLVDIKPASRDRRMRLIYLTKKGAMLEQRLFSAVRERIAQAYRTAGPDAVSGFWDVMSPLAGDDPQDHGG